MSAPEPFGVGRFIGPLVVGVLLVVAGLYLRSGAGDSPVPTLFIWVGAVSVVLNLALLGWTRWSSRGQRR